MAPTSYSEPEEPVHCKVKEVIFKTNNRHPIIVSFQNGKLVPESTTDLHCGIYNCNTTKKKVVAATTNEITYKGTLEEDEKNLCRILLAVRNKRTNKVRLVEVDQVELKPSFESRGILSETNAEDAFNNLYKSFGSKKIKRAIGQRNMQKFDIDAMEEQISQALEASTSIMNESTTNKSFDTANELVPCNRNATHVFEVYKLEDFISHSELDSFNDLAIKLNKDPSASESYSKFFQTCLNKVPNNIHCTKILLYAECLLKFISMGYKDLRKKNVVICPESQSLNNRILETFTVSSDSGRTRSNQLRDKAICFIIVLGLLANNYTLSVDPISQTIKIGLSKLQQLCRVVGTVPLDRNKNIQVLKLPLPAIVTNTRKKQTAGFKNK